MEDTVKRERTLAKAQEEAIKAVSALQAKEREKLVASILSEVNSILINPNDHAQLDAALFNLGQIIQDAPDAGMAHAAVNDALKNLNDGQRKQLDLVLKNSESGITPVGADALKTALAEQIAFAVTRGNNAFAAEGIKDLVLREIALTPIPSNVIRQDYNEVGAEGKTGTKNILSQLGVQLKRFSPRSAGMNDIEHPPAHGADANFVANKHKTTDALPFTARSKDSSNF